MRLRSQSGARRSDSVRHLLVCVHENVAQRLIRPAGPVPTVGRYEQHSNFGCSCAIYRFLLWGVIIH